MAKIRDHIFKATKYFKIIATNKIIKAKTQLFTFRPGLNDYTKIVAFQAF